MHQIAFQTESADVFVRALFDLVQPPVQQALKITFVRIVPRYPLMGYIEGQRRGRVAHVSEQCDIVT